MAVVTGVVPSAKYSTPWAAVGKVLTLTEAMVPSTSVPVKFTATVGASSKTVIAYGVAIGASFTGVTLKVMVFGLWSVF